jgi:glycerol-3-phosphate dehydrogenase (NAD(P)+)
MAVVLILGAGVMGTAFAVPLGDTGNDIRLVGTHLDGEIIESIRATGMHPRLRAPVHERVRAFHYHELDRALGDEVVLIVLGVSSPGVGWAIEQLRGRLPGARLVLLLTKGIEAQAGRLRTFPEPVEEALHAPCGGIAGPCIAQELAVRRQSAVVCTFERPELIELVRGLVAAPYYHVRPSTDRIGVEVCAASKNFFTVGIGAGNAPEPAGNGAMAYNHAADLFAQAILEMGDLNAALGGRAETVVGLAGTGDLYVTVQGGRNSRLGRHLGQGLRFSEVMRGPMAGETVEGAQLALDVGPTMLAMMRAGLLKEERMPLACAIIAAIGDDRPLELPWVAMHRQAEVYGERA